MCNRDKEGGPSQRSSGAKDARSSLAILIGLSWRLAAAPSYVNPRFWYHTVLGYINCARVACQSLLLALLPFPESLLAMSDSHSDDIQKAGQDHAAYSLAQRRRAALEQVDSASFKYVVWLDSFATFLILIIFSRFHIKVCFVAGVGFFTDAYGMSADWINPCFVN